MTQAPTTGSEDTVILEEMFVQIARNVTSDESTLTLQDVSPSTLYFSDRPERLIGHLTTSSHRLVPPSNALAYGIQVALSRARERGSRSMSFPPGQDYYGAPNPYGVVHTQVVAHPYRSSTAHLVIAWIVAVLTVGYMLPWAIAATRNKSNTAAIALINLLLGWSLVGWIVALVMSLTSEAQPAVYLNTAVLPGQYPHYGQPAYGPGAAQAPALPPGQQQPTYGGQPNWYGNQSSEPTAIIPQSDDANRWQGPTYR